MAEKKNVNLENNMLSDDELDMVSGGETTDECLGQDLEVLIQEPQYEQGTIMEDIDRKQYQI